MFDLHGHMGALTKKRPVARTYGHWAENPNHVWALIDSTGGANLLLTRPELDLLYLGCE